MIINTVEGVVFKRHWKNYFSREKGAVFSEKFVQRVGFTHFSLRLEGESGIFSKILKGQGCLPVHPVLETSKQNRE